MSYGEENKLSMNKQIGENGAWVKDHLDECDFVIQYFSEKKSSVIYWDKKFLQEAYNECKYKDLDVYYFIDCMNIERHANGRAKFNGWVPPLAEDAISALDYVNQKVYWEGHYSAGAFFNWFWEQDVNSNENEKCGYLYILKKPNRFKN